MVKYLLLIGVFLYGLQLKAQTVQDSLPAFADTGRTITAPLRTADTPAREYLPHTRRDTIVVAAAPVWLSDTARFAGHPVYRFTQPSRYTVSIREWQGKEVIFYSIVALLLFFAFIRNGFYRYIQDLFKIYFRTTVRQRQLRDQLLQSPLPSLLLNIFFILSIGMFVALLFQYFVPGMPFSFWMLLLYCVLALVAIYSVKFLMLKFMGWIFQMSEAIDTYIFIVFTTNKIIGIVLLPFLIVLAFSYGPVSQVAMTLGITAVVGLIAYRFFLSYITIHRQVKVSFFHFLLYLAAFEVVPVLLINKLLFRFLEETS